MGAATMAAPIILLGLLWYIPNKLDIHLKKGKPS